MENNFTPLHFKTQIVEFDLFYQPDTDTYRSVVCAPIDFEAQFKFVKGTLTKVSNNPDFYDGLIGGVERAILNKKHLFAQNKSSSFFSMIAGVNPAAVYKAGRQELAAYFKKGNTTRLRPISLPRLFE